MYVEDSFFTLTVPGQIGLAMLSSVLALLTIGTCWKLSTNRPLWARLLIGLFLFVVFIWLAPQIYYTYYIFILDDLPWQIVGGWSASPFELLKILTFQERTNLSFHAQGFLGWLLVAVAAFRNRF